MTSFPDPDQDGSYFFRANNGRGKQAQFGIESGPSPRALVKTAGNGFDVLDASGLPIFNVPESGFVPPPPGPQTVQTVNASTPLSPTNNLVLVEPPDANTINIQLPAASLNPGRILYFAMADPGFGVDVQIVLNPGDFFINNSAPTPLSFNLGTDQFVTMVSFGSNIWFLSNNL